MSQPRRGIIEGFGSRDTAGPRRVTIAGKALDLPELRTDEARHSPTGFSWGYGGSGPAELSRALLIALYPDDPVVRHPRCYQDFKFAVIAKLPPQFVMTSDDIDIWYQAWRAANRDTAEWIAEDARLRRSPDPAAQFDDPKYPRGIDAGPEVM